MFQADDVADILRATIEFVAQLPALRDFLNSVIMVLCDPAVKAPGSKVTACFAQTLGRPPPSGAHSSVEALHDAVQHGFCSSPNR